MLIKTHNPEQAFRLFSSEEWLPQPGSLTLSAINRQVVSRVEEHFEAQTEVVGQILLLFGPELAGIATRVAGRSAVVDLARRLFEYRYLVEGYPFQDLPREVESLLNRLHLFLTELAQQYPFLLNRPQTRHNCLLNFYTDSAHLPFVEYMAGPAFVYLIKRREGLQEVSKNYNHSLTSVLQPARDLARYFATHRPPSYREVYQDERLGWELLHRLEAYFRSLPNRQLAGQPRAESTVERDVALTKAMLGLPYLGQQTERRRLLVRSDYQRQPALFPEIFVPFDDAELPDAAWETSPSPNKVQAPPMFEVATENLDLELASYLPGFTSFGSEKETAADTNFEILPYPQAVATTSGVVSEVLALARENLPRPERYVRLNHLQDRATLEQHPGEWDSNLIPPLVLGLALVAPFTFATSTAPGSDAQAEREPGVEDDPGKSRLRVSFVPLDKLELEQLERLLFLELALTTGREPLSLLQMEIRPWTALSKASFSPGQLVYVPFHNTIYTVPGSLRGLPRIFKEAPDREKEPGRYADWKKLVEITHRSYRPTQEIMALALHPATRHLMACYYRRRLTESNEPEPLKFFRVAEQAAGETLLKPRQLEARLLEPINHYLKKVLPLEPPISFNRLSRTGWVYLVKEGKLGPALAHLESGQLKPELNARLHYVGVDRATFEARVNAAQEVILHKLAQAQAEACPSVKKRAQEREREREWTEEGEQTVRFSELARRLGIYNTTRPVFNRKPSLASQVPAVDVFYGTGFCPYSEMLQALTGVLLQDYARLPQFYRASSLELEQVSYNLLVYLCAYLTAVCCGVRKSELVLTTLSGLDLAHDPALLSLNGKRDRFNTEPRSLPLPKGLVRLWEVVLYLRNRLLPTRREGSAQALYIFSELSSSGKRSKTTSSSSSPSSQSQEEEKEKKEESLQPLSAEQLWHFLEKAAASLQLRDFLFRFHSFRQNLWYFLRQRGAEEEVVEYLLGHQSAGSEILHPFAGRDLPSLYQHILPHLEALLESLGISEPVITALVCRDYQGLSQLLPQPVEAPFYDDWVLPAQESELEVESEVEEAAQSEGGRADRLVARTEIIREEEV